MWSARSSSVMIGRPQRVGFVGQSRRRSPPEQEHVPCKQLTTLPESAVLRAISRDRAEVERSATDPRILQRAPRPSAASVYCVINRAESLTRLSPTIPLHCLRRLPRHPWAVNKSYDQTKRARMGGRRPSSGLLPRHLTRNYLTRAAPRRPLVRFAADSKPFLSPPETHCPKLSQLWSRSFSNSSRGRISR